MRGDRRRPSSGRAGAVLLEVMVALAILAVAGVAAVAATGESMRAAARLRESEHRIREASAFLEAVALWPRDDRAEFDEDISGMLADSETFPAFGAFDGGRLVGFAEAGERAYGDGCDTAPVGWLDIERFAAINYKDHWRDVRVIQKGTGVSYNQETLSKLPKKGE